MSTTFRSRSTASSGALSAPPPIALREQHPVFRLEIFGRQPTIEDTARRAVLVGPVPYGGMTHQEFLDMVTPKQVQAYQDSPASISSRRPPSR
jgi:hypothetical protein